MQSAKVPLLAFHFRQGSSYDNNWVEIRIYQASKTAALGAAVYSKRFENVMPGYAVADFTGLGGELKSIRLAKIQDPTCSPQPPMASALR